MAPPKFPLPANFFRCPMLSPAAEAQLMRTASANAVDLVAHCILDGTGPLQWTLESNSNDIQIYTANDPTLPSHVLSYAGVVEIQASVDEVASLFQTHTTDLYKDFRRRFASDLLDGHNLYSLAQPTDDHPLKAVNIKWTVNEMPGGGLLKNRDWCFLESMYEFEQDGRRGWVRAVYSTELLCCPDLEPSLGVVRGTFFRSGHVFLESDRPGYIRGTQLFQASMNGGFQKGLMPSWVIKTGVRRRIRGISDIQTFVRETRLSQGPLMDTWDLVAKSARSRCHLCNKKFGPLVRKARCRKCGEVVCHSCSSLWTLAVSKTPVRACSACALGLVAPHAVAAELVKSAPVGMQRLATTDARRGAIDKPMRHTMEEPQLRSYHMHASKLHTSSQDGRIEFYDIAAQKSSSTVGDDTVVLLEQRDPRQHLMHAVGFDEDAVYSTQGPIVLLDARYDDDDPDGSAFWLDSRT